MKKIISKKILTFLLILSFVTSGVLFINPRESNAQFLVVDVENFLKELTLDAIAWQLINMVIHQISIQTVNWINSGFDGNPLYITNLDFYLGFVCAQAANKFMSEFQNSNVDPVSRRLVARSLAIANPCSPYGNSGNLGDILQQTLIYEVGYITNWGAWRRQYLNPLNSPYGQYLIASSELNRRIANDLYREQQQLGWAQGFLSQRKCSREEVSEGVTREVCKITTLGTTIQNRLNTILDSDLQRLQIADEINEILGALMFQLTNQVFGGIHGLLGGSDGSGRFTPQNNTEAINSSTSKIIDVTDDQLATELSYRNTKIENLVELNKIKNNLESPGDQNSLSTINALIVDVEADIQSSINISNQLEAIKNSAENTNTNEELFRVANDFSNIQTNVHTVQDVVEAKQQLFEIIELKNFFNTETGLDL